MLFEPHFKARTNHRYDTGDYMTVDPMLGDEEDFKRLCADEKMGIKVLLDGCSAIRVRTACTSTATATTLPPAPTRARIRSITLVSF